MGRGNNSPAHCDKDKEFFTSLEEANYECQSPVKKPSESTMLLSHVAHCRALRTKAVITLSLLLLAGVGTTSLYSSVDTSTSAMEMHGPTPKFWGNAIPSSDEVFGGDGMPDFENAILDADETVAMDKEDYKAQDNLLLDEMDPYDEFYRAGNTLENK